MCGRKCGRKLTHRLLMMLMDHQHCCCHPADSDDGDDCRTNLFDDGRCESIVKAPNNPPMYLSSNVVVVGGENRTRLYWTVIDVSVLNVVVLLHLHRLIMIVVVHVMLLVVDDDGGMLCTTPLNGERVLSST